MAAVQIRPLGYAVGASVTGIDLRRKPGPDAVAALREAWLAHQMLCFPDQDLSDQRQFVEFAECFGEIDRSSASHDRDPKNESIILLTNQAIDGKPWDGHKQGQYWHSDQSQTVTPNPATFVLAKHVPDVGGDTLFANQYMAYETLSPALQSMLEGLEAVHDSELRVQYGKTTGFVRPEGTEPRKRLPEPPVVHPAVIVHPETGRKALYLDLRVSHFVGMTREETKPLLDYLIAHATRYEFTYRHRWTANDLVMWDNRCLMHHALVDYDQINEARHLWRTALRGPAIGRFYHPEERELVPA